MGSGMLALPRDTLAEWSKAVDSSSTIFGCVGSNPTGVIISVDGFETQLVLVAARRRRASEQHLAWPIARQSTSAVGGEFRHAL